MSPLYVKTFSAKYQPLIHASNSHQFQLSCTHIAEGIIWPIKFFLSCTSWSHTGLQKRVFWEEWTPYHFMFSCMNNFFVFFIFGLRHTLCPTFGRKYSDMFPQFKWAFMKIYLLIFYSSWKKLNPFCLSKMKRQARFLVSIKKKNR